MKKIFSGMKVGDLFTFLKHSTLLGVKPSGRCNADRLHLHRNGMHVMDGNPQVDLGPQNMSHFPEDEQRMHSNVRHNTQSTTFGQEDMEYCQ